MASQPDDFDRLISRPAPGSSAVPSTSSRSPVINGAADAAAPTARNTPGAHLAPRRSRHGAFVGVSILAIAAVAAGVVIGVSALPQPQRAAASAAVPEPVAPEVAPTTDPGPVRIADLVDEKWADRISTASGIPIRALKAYAGAALLLKRELPACRLGWNTLAAIGRVETEHGTVFGGVVADDGEITPAIIGLPLDGSRFDAIADTDGGKYDGDSTWDRAVGPMQFIPSTWEAYAQDGNGDGVLDPNQIDDAALTTARYLCSFDGDLSQGTDWVTAIAGYNSAADYNDKVSGAARFYASVR